MLVGGIAVAADISVRYFDEAGSKPLPESVRRALEGAVTRYGTHDSLLLGETINAYVFTTSTGSGRVYMAPYRRTSGFCAALAVVGKPVQASCSNDGAGSVATLAGNGIQPWNLSLTPAMHALLGRFTPAGTGDKVEIGFEDGTSDAVPMHGRWFAYAVAGKRVEAGHRPVSLNMLHGDRIVRRVALDPISFNTLAAARALVPAGNGSRAQEAIRRVLLDQLPSGVGDGGALASQTDLAKTSFVTSLAFSESLRLSLYAAPIGHVHGWPGNGSILAGIDNHSARPVVSRVGANARATAAFDVGSCSCVLPGHPRATFVLLYGSVPSGVSTITVRSFDGRESRAAILASGREWVWLGHDAKSTRPIALTGRDEAGTTITTHHLTGRFR